MYVYIYGTVNIKTGFRPFIFMIRSPKGRSQQNCEILKGGTAPTSIVRHS